MCPLTLKAACEIHLSMKLTPIIDWQLQYFNVKSIVGEVEAETLALNGRFLEKHYLK
jgi:hypothetical protein